jgi:heptose-I-phosphate ethanolaminephosphotransferase
MNSIAKILLRIKRYHSIFEIFLILAISILAVNVKLYSGKHIISGEIRLKSDAPCTVQLFFDSGSGYNEDKSQKFHYSETQKYVTYQFTTGLYYLKNIRLDPFDISGSSEVQEFLIKQDGKEFDLLSLPKIHAERLNVTKELSHTIKLESITESDPWISYHIPNAIGAKHNKRIHVLLFFIFALSAILCWSLSSFYFTAIHKTARKLSRKAYKTYTRLVESNILFFILFFCFNSTYFIYIFLHQKSFLMRSALYFFELFFEASIVVFLVGHIRFRWIRISCKIIILGASGIFFFADLFSLYTYKTIFNLGMFQIVMASNFHETSEFIKLHLSYYYLIIFIAAAVLLFIGRRQIKRLILFISRKNKYKKYVFLLIAFTSILISIRSCMRYSEFMSQECLSLSRLTVMSYNAKESIAEFRSISGKIHHDITLTENSGSIPYFIYILGESTNRNHLGVYGYHLNTTPHLSALADKHQIAIFTDVISPHSHTIPVLENIFTFYRVGMGGQWYEQSNIFDILNKAGYRTHWLSNQESSGLFGNVGKIYSDMCSVKEFTMIRDSKNEDESLYDESLLPLIDKSLQSDNTRNFYVIHLMGTHVGYKMRYPSSFNVFSVSDETGESIQQRQMKSEYDNAVRYNDYIVWSIINRFTNLNAIVLYASDHGEEVYDYRDYCGHDEIHGSRYMIEIPMIVWMSESFTNSYPDTARRIKGSVNRPFMTDDMIHAILGIMKIHTSDFDERKSIFSDHYDSKRKRIYAGKNYDSEMRK